MNSKTILYRRNAQGKPIVWSGYKTDDIIVIEHGLVGGNLIKEVIPITAVKVDELESRITLKRKEGYKELSELKDNTNLSWAESTEIQAFVNNSIVSTEDLIRFLDTYLPKYSTTSEGFVLPMLAKVLEDNKPFEKYGKFLGQWKINGLRCIIGAKADTSNMFIPITLTYHSRTGEDWTNKMSWMDDIIIPKLSSELLDLMIETGACLDGELYLPGYPVNMINSFVKNTELSQHYKLQYWCYDICCEDMTAEERRDFRVNNITFTYSNMFDIKTKEHHLNNKNQLILLQSWDIEDITEAIKFRDEFINLGFEGLILRNPNSTYQFGKRNQSMFKFKKIDDGIFTIVNIEEDKRGLPIYTLKNDINDELFQCTLNASQEAQRAHLQVKDTLIGKKALVEFRERSGIKQVPFHAKIRSIYV